jgi:hypothetical protein
LYDPYLRIIIEAVVYYEWTIACIISLIITATTRINTLILIISRQPSENDLDLCRWSHRSHVSPLRHMTHLNRPAQRTTKTRCLYRRRRRSRTRVSSAHLMAMWMSCWMDEDHRLGHRSGMSWVLQPLFIDIYLYFTFGLWIVRRGRCKAVLLMNRCFKSTCGWSCTSYPQNKWYYIAWLSWKYYIISQSPPISICFEVSKTAMDAVSELYRHHRNLPDISLPATASGCTIHEAFPFEYTIAGWILFVNINAHIEICHLVPYCIVYKPELYRPITLITLCHNTVMQANIVMTYKL